MSGLQNTSKEQTKIWELCCRASLDSWYLCENHLQYRQVQKATRLDLVLQSLTLRQSRMFIYIHILPPEKKPKSNQKLGAWNWRRNTFHIRQKSLLWFMMASPSFRQDTTPLFPEKLLQTLHKKPDNSDFCSTSLDSVREIASSTPCSWILRIILPVSNVYLLTWQHCFLMPDSVAETTNRSPKHSTLINENSSVP